MAEHRSELKRMQDQAEIAQRYLRGEKQVVIAQAMGLKPMTVSRELRKIRQRWRDSAIVDFHEAKIIQLAKLDQIEREAWAAWDASRQPRTLHRQNAVPGNVTPEDPQAKPVPKATSLTTVSQDGEVRFLATIQWCLQERAKLLGLYEPTKFVNADEVDLGEYISFLTPEQRAQRIVEMLHAAEAEENGDDGDGDNGSNAAPDTPAPDFPAADVLGQVEPATAPPSSAPLRFQISASAAHASTEPAPADIDPLANYTHEAPPSVDPAERFVGMLPARR